ncbi:MAG: HAMP domain-containing sensor histidine kinase [Nocardioidaceae bacterium]
MAGGRVERDVAVHRVLVPCATAIIACTSVLLLVSLTTLDRVSTGALTMHAFEVGTSALFLTAGLLRISRWRVTTDPHSGLLAGAMMVLGLLALPVDDLTGTMPPAAVEPAIDLALRALGTAVCVALALRAMTVHDDRSPISWVRTLIASATLAVAGLGALVTLFAVAPTDVSGLALVHSAVNVLLAGAWVTLGLAASLRDTKQPWAGRVAPLYASLGLVELLQGLDQLDPGTWSLPAAALLGSVATITAHAAYVDLVESARFASTIRQRTAEISAQTSGKPGTAPASTEPVGDFDVALCVETVVEQRQASGQEIRLRGGAGFARARAGDLTVALEKLLVNAHTYARTSPVTVNVVAIGSRIEVSVADHGPGMSAAAADSAFGSAEAGRGSGLGLHVARALMEHNDGDLELRNRIGGTTFVLTLPAAEDQHTPLVIPAWDALPQHA